MASEYKVLNEEALEVLCTAVKKVADIDNIIDDVSPRTNTVYSSAKIQEELDKVFQSVSNGKELLASAITDVGINTSEEDTFENIISNINKLQVTGGGAGGVVAVYSTVPNMTSNTSPSGVASASSVNGSTYPAYKAFADNTAMSSGWISANGKTTGEWLQYEFTKPHVIVKINIRNRYGGSLDLVAPMVAFRFEGSDNGVDYDVLLETRSTDISSQKTHSYTIPSTKSYKMFRIVCTEITDDPKQKYVAIGHLEMIGYEEDSKIVLRNI